MQSPGILKIRINWQFITFGAIGGRTRRGHRDLVLRVYVRDTEQSGQRVANSGSIEAVEGAENPPGSEKYGFRNPDLAGRKQGFGTPVTPLAIRPNRRLLRAYSSGTPPGVSSGTVSRI